ncbi:RusA family crossover junction endodeoxyribonuclease [Pseudomonas typographi]|uniref:RusA family crossover junction endodeoxyribonuclease n=1 Tax=Pseudomonas typographi TaxID=2715964 RepID=A0ABR7Z9C1_9PSED|nr:RusA family crossover junction endodeoxyribonuclease [Pseudomonas typographi]MBD1601968.1 RusA family crossover junction endodeoxyribonuclease [Pseudomonas typographi]
MTMLELPWPPAACSPNARSHWRKKANAARKYRADCHLLALQAKIAAPAGELLVVMEFVPPDARRRDLDNLLSSCKALLDGIADALKVDDRNFIPQLRMSKETTKGGAVRVRIQAVEGEAA